MTYTFKAISLPLKLLLAISLLINIGLIAKFTKNQYDYRARTKPSSKITYMNNKETVYEMLPITNTDIVFIGDSQTQRFDLFEFFKNPNLINRGIDGDFTAGVLNRLMPIVKGHPAKIFLQIGINDLGYHQLTVDSAIHNYKVIINTIKSKTPSTQVFVESILPTKTVNKDSILVFNDELKKLSLNNGLTFINLYDYFSDNGTLKREYNCGDDLHLNGRGYLEWKEILKNYL